MEAANDVQRDDWDRHWEDLEAANLVNPAQEYRHELVLRNLRLGSAAAARVLDVGSGIGEFLRILDARYPDIPKAWPRGEFAVVSTSPRVVYHRPYFCKSTCLLGMRILRRTADLRPTRYVPKFWNMSTIRFAFSAMRALTWQRGAGSWSPCRKAPGRPLTCTSGTGGISRRRNFARCLTKQGSRSNTRPVQASHSSIYTAWPSFYEAISLWKM